MYRLYIIIIIIYLHKCSSNDNDFFSTNIAMRFLDRQDEDNLFYDRVVSVLLRMVKPVPQNKLIAPAVFIDSRRVLTSYNAFRHIMRDREMNDRICVCFLNKRLMRLNRRLAYIVSCSNITCGRPVVPMFMKELTDEQWHGPDKKHTPLHDLLVIQMKGTAKFYTPDREYLFGERFPPNLTSPLTLKVGPLLTRIATLEQKMTKRIRFCSIGLYDAAEALEYYRMNEAEYEDGDIVEVNCDEWLPRSWGYFICLWNDEKFKGFSSGAMLFSGTTLFGVGSFTLWRGKDSILAFTDVRPYFDQIQNTCTKTDLFSSGK